MRIGVNPQKLKNEINTQFLHRVIIVVHIPNTTEAYYKDMIAVFEQSLLSIINSIDKEQTVISIINNASCKEAESIILKHKTHIDKYVLYEENKGKVYAALNEAKSSYEPFVTITDADILFFKNWEQAVFDIFNEHPNAGVVAPYPCPYLTFYHNQSVFGLNSLFNKIKYGKFVSDLDIDMYIKGTNLPNVINRKNKYNWKEKQYILEGKTQSIIGAYHVVATYKTTQFQNSTQFPKVKFKNSYEEFFIDNCSDKLGLYRLSTVQSYMYHMGNTIDDTALHHIKNNNSIKLEKPIIKTNLKILNYYYVFANRIMGRVFIKFKWNRK